MTGFVQCIMGFWNDSEIMIEVSEDMAGEGGQHNVMHGLTQQF
jgi:hypothetical protein